MHKNNVTQNSRSAPHTTPLWGVGCVTPFVSFYKKKIPREIETDIECLVKDHNNSIANAQELPLPEPSHRYALHIARQNNTTFCITQQWQGQLSADSKKSRTPHSSPSRARCVVSRKFGTTFPTPGNHKIAPLSARQSRRMRVIQ